MALSTGTICMVNSEIGGCRTTALHPRRVPKIPSRDIQSTTTYQGWLVPTKGCRMTTWSRINTKFRENVVVAVKGETFAVNHTLVTLLLFAFTSFLFCQGTGSALFLNKGLVGKSTIELALMIDCYWSHGATGNNFKKVAIHFLYFEG